MADNWDDSDEDEWDVDSDDDELNKRLGNLSTTNNKTSTAPAVVTEDDEEDLAVKEQEIIQKQNKIKLQKKGNALQAKKKAEMERKEEEEIARKAMELETKMEENMTEDERRVMERRRVEEEDMANDDLFGGGKVGEKKVVGGAGAGDVVLMKDLKDHLKHARKVAQCIKGHKKTHLASAFFKECIQESKDVLDDDAVSDLIKVLNVIKNDKVAAMKRKVKGQAQKSAKRDKAAEAKARKIQAENFGDSNEYDEYDEYEDEYADGYF